MLASTTGALTLLNDVEQHKLAPAVDAQARAQGIAATSETARDLFRSFDPNADSVERLGTSPDMAQLLALKGDADRGRQIFFGAANQGLCARCHKIDNAGGDFGPDLSHIATRYNQHDLLDNILNPSKTIAQGYTTYVIRTRSGDLFTGLITERTDDHLTIRDAQLKSIKIAIADIDRSAPQTVSSMPDGILADLTPGQAADLLAFLSARK
jgi:putative heme-binding domain-containing protein